MGGSGVVAEGVVFVGEDEEGGRIAVHDGRRQNETGVATTII